MLSVYLKKVHIYIDVLETYLYINIIIYFIINIIKYYKYMQSLY